MYAEFILLLIIIYKSYYYLLTYTPVRYGTSIWQRKHVDPQLKHEAMIIREVEDDIYSIEMYYNGIEVFKFGLIVYYNSSEINTILNFCIRKLNYKELNYNR